MVKTLTLYYKTNKQNNYENKNLFVEKNQGDTRYDSLFKEDFTDDQFLQVLGSDDIDYYFVASDGTNETTSDKKWYSYWGRPWGTTVKYIRR